MKVGVGADHGGFEVKQQLAKLLATEGHQVVTQLESGMLATANTSE